MQSLSVSERGSFWSHQCKVLFLSVYSGIVGDIVLNHVPLKNFAVYSLDMMPSFLNRFEYKLLNDGVTSYNMHILHLKSKVNKTILTSSKPV